MIFRRRAQADEISRHQEIQVVYAVPSEPEENKGNQENENLVQDVNNKKESSSFISHIQVRLPLAAMQRNDLVSARTTLPKITWYLNQKMRDK